MKNFNREAIQRMFDGRKGGGGGGTNNADLAGYATQMWVNQNYVSIEFFNRLFSVHGHDPEDESSTPTDISVLPNDMDSIVDSIESMVGFYTEEYLSALGLNPDSGSGNATTLYELLDVKPNSDVSPSRVYGLEGTSADNGKVLTYSTTYGKWIAAANGAGSGSVTSIDMTVPTGFSVSGAPITTYGTLAITFGGSIAKNKVLASPANATGSPDWRTLVASDIPDLSATYASASDVTTLQGYFDNLGNANSANKLAVYSKTAWGQTYWTSGGVPDNISGDMTSVGDITASSNGTKDIKGFRCLEMYGAASSNFGGYIDFHYNNDSGDYTSRIIEDASGVLKINNTIWATLSGDVGVGTSTTYTKLTVNGGVKTTKLYLYKPNTANDTNAVYFEYDSANAGVHLVGAGFYGNSYISALGLNSQGGGGSITLNEPLNGINNAGLSAPTSSAAGQTVVWNGSAWTYSINTTLRAGNLASAGSATIYGNIISSTGSASIYGNIDSSTGKLRMPRNGGAIQFYLDSTYGYTTAMRVFTGSTTLSLGYETAHDASYDTNIYGYNIGLIYGNSSGYGIFINSSGNVGIGLTTNNTYKLQVNGTAFASSFMVAESGTAYRLPHKIKLNNSFYYSDSNGMVDLGTVGGGGSGDLSNYVTLNTNQEITAFKSFSGAAYIYGISYQNLFVGTTNQAKTPCIAFFESSTGTQNVYGGLCMKSENGSLFRYTKNVASIYTIWDSGNDGSGSSLDADLLDGQHGSYYATASDVTTLQGYFTSGVANSAKRLAQSSDGVTSLSSFIHSTDLIYMAAGGGNTIADKPSGVTAFGALSFKVAAGYYGQILYATNGHMYIRESDTLSGGWTEIITSAIIGSQTVSTASKLSTVSQTLFGNTYWTSGGVPTSIGYDSSHRANLWYVADISMKGSITIYDSNDNDFAIFWREGNDCIDMYAHENGYHNMCLGMASSTTDGLYFDGSSQRWGIGTHSPSQKLEVNGDVKANNFRGALIGNADTATTATTASKLSAVSKTAWGRTYWTSGGVPDSISGDIDNAANVTMSGYLKMQRNGGAIQFYLDSTNGYTTAMRVFTGSNSLSLGYETAGLGYETIIYGDNVQLHYGSSRTTGFYLESTGNVGIGTSSPSAKIDVNGSANVSGDLTVNGGNINISNNKYIYWKDSGGTSRTAIFLSDSNNFRVGYGIASAGYDTIISGNNIKFTYGTSRTDGFMLNNSGNVGIGTTSPSEKMHVVGNILASGSTANGTYIQIGDIRIVYDNDATNGNNALKVVKSDGTAANFYATGAVSALGANTSSGGAGDYIPLSGSTAITGSLVPATINTYDLGSSTKAWGTIYCNAISGNASLSVQNVSCTTFSTSARAVISSGAKFASICIESDSSGNISSGNVGEINRFNGALHLQYRTTDYAITMFNKLSFSYTLPSSGVMEKGTLSTNGKAFLLDTGTQHPYYTAAWQSWSDMRKKNIVHNIAMSIDQIANAPIFAFTWIGQKDNEISIGTSAQYWQKVLPEAVSTAPDGFLAMDYIDTALAAAVVTARKVQNHEDRIRELEERLSLSEAENKALREEIELLKAA